MTYRKRQIAIGDIHGCFDLLKTLIEERIAFTPESDQLICMGDYIDRQMKSREVVEYVSGLRERNPGQVVLLKGNHEDLANKALMSSESGLLPTGAMLHWYLNGGTATVQSYEGFRKARKALVPFIDSLTYYYETDTHIFVHGGIPFGSDVKAASETDMLWDRSLSYRGQKTLVVGHTPVPAVEKIGNIICVDTGAFHTGVLSAYDVLNNTTFEARDDRGG